MAEAIYKKLTSLSDVESAGAVATGEDHISSRALVALHEIGIEAKGQYSKQLTPEMVQAADKVVLFPTDFMPEYAKQSPKAELWDIIDPHYHQEQGMKLVETVRDKIYEKVTELTKEAV